MKSSTHCSWDLYVLSFLGDHSSFPFSLVVCRSLEFEVIVIDDNSPDGTQDVVKKLQKLYGAQQLASSPGLTCYFTSAQDKTSFSMAKGSAHPNRLEHINRHWLMLHLYLCTFRLPCSYLRLVLRPSTAEVTCHFVAPEA